VRLVTSRSASGTRIRDFHFSLGNLAGVGLGIATREWEGVGVDNNCGKIPAQHISFSHESRYYVDLWDYFGLKLASMSIGLRT